MRSIKQWSVITMMVFVYSLQIECQGICDYSPDKFAEQIAIFYLVELRKYCLISKDWYVYNLTTTDDNHKIDERELRLNGTVPVALKDLWPVMYNFGYFYMNRNKGFPHLVHAFESDQLLIHFANGEDKVEILRFDIKSNDISDEIWTYDDGAKEIFQADAVWLTAPDQNYFFVFLLNQGDWELRSVQMDLKAKQFSGSHMSFMCKAGDGLMFSNKKCEHPWEDKVIQAMLNNYYLYLYCEKKVHGFRSYMDRFPKDKTINLTSVDYKNFVICDYKFLGLNTGTLIIIGILVALFGLLIVFALCCMCGRSSGRRGGRSCRSSRSTPRSSRRTSRKSKRPSSRRARSRHSK